MDELDDLNNYISEHFGLDNTSKILKKVDDTTPEAIDYVSDVDNDDKIDDDSSIRHFLEKKDKAVPNDDDDHIEPLFEEDCLPNVKLTRGCGCEKSCFNQFNLEKLVDHIWDLREMPKQEKETVIMTVLNSVGITSSKTRRGDRKRTVYQYTFNNTRICRNAFLIIYDIHDFTLRALISHIHENGLTPRIHGNKGRKPKNALNFDDVQKVVQFLRSFADENGLPQPAAPRGRPDIPPLYLPSSMTKKSVHKAYIESASPSGTRIVKISAFCEIWKSCVPHICIASPRHDVCAGCEKFRKIIMDAVSEEEKMEATSKMQDHLVHAQKERDYYMKKIRDAQADVTMRSDNHHSHYTFDFAQNVSLPHHARQMGPLYFLSLKKVQVFGFRDDGIPRQSIYLFDESQCIGQDGKLSHGPNSVISMVDHGLETMQKQGEETCSLHADNCAGQNKNRFVLAYLAWRVMTGRHKNISLHMQIPGHTRCLIDAGFAQFKRNYRRSDADCMADLVDQVNRSSRVNKAVVYPAWAWRDWKTFLSLYFKSLNKISSFQHFRFSYNQPGVVYAAKTPDDNETEVMLLKDASHRFDHDALPIRIETGGLSRQRQNYLYQNIRRYVRPRDMDKTCPCPDEE